MSLSFNARASKARKQHQCWACERTIATGEVYIAYPGKGSDGRFVTTHLCVECSFLITQKTGANAQNIRQGELTDRLIPNFLRKKRAEFRKDPIAAITAAGLVRSTPKAPKPVQRIVVKASEFERRIFHLPESRFKAEQFPKGGPLNVKAGVNGKSRAVTIKGAWSTSGEAFGCNKRQVAILVA